MLTEREVGRGSVVLREGERQKKGVWVRARLRKRLKGAGTRKYEYDVM